MIELDEGEGEVNQPDYAIKEAENNNYAFHIVGPYGYGAA